ncbi:MAG: hypothetical protein B7X07_01430 [Actinobacteria bacterium 21-64-8]|nr:MAG: hypothetical protein B7X07_01430 [Actinobacteria bacterium 21-64-8]
MQIRQRCAHAFFKYHESPLIATRVADVAAPRLVPVRSTPPTHVPTFQSSSVIAIPKQRKATL